MHPSNDILIHVIDWPSIRHRTDISLDAALHATEAGLRAWCASRFGPGELVHAGEDEWEYRRHLRGPRGLWLLGGLLLNKSYR